MVKFDEVDKCFKIAFRVEACYNKKRKLQVQVGHLHGRTK